MTTGEGEEEEGGEGGEGGGEGEEEEEGGREHDASDQGIGKWRAGSKEEDRREEGGLVREGQQRTEKRLWGLRVIGRCTISRALLSCQKCTIRITPQYF